MSRLRRFLHLERPRGEEPADADPRARTAGRFAGVERPARRPDAQAGSGASLERFGPDPDPSLELVEAAAGERPFTRCMRCGMDHHLFATGCSGCGASLDTAAQHEFNERLWERRQEETVREERGAAERRALQDRAEAELSEARRAMGEELAREVGQRERRRLASELGSGGWGERLLAILARRRRGR